MNRQVCDGASLLALLNGFSPKATADWRSPKRRRSDLASAVQISDFELRIS